MTRTIRPPMSFGMTMWLAAALAIAWTAGCGPAAESPVPAASATTVEPAESRGEPGGPIHGLRVLSDKVPDLSSLQAIRAHLSAFETDREKADELFRLAGKFRHQANPALEYLTKSGHVHDPIKTLNVYGYCKCCCAAAMMMGLWRSNDMRAEGWSLVKHSVSDVFYDGEWHMYDVSLMNYFVREDGVIASSQDLVDLKHEIINHERSPFIDELGQYPARAQWLPADGFGDYEVEGDNHVYEYHYSMGHRVGVDLREGEKIVFNWGNHGLHINQYEPHEWDAPMEGTGAVGSQIYLKDWYPNYRMGLVGNGDYLYRPDLGAGTYRGGILSERNTTVRMDGALPSLQLDSAGTGEIVFPFKNDYVWLEGAIRATVRRDSSSETVAMQISRNHGLDWETLWTAERTGTFDVEIDLTRWIFGRYQHQIRLVLDSSDPGSAAVSGLEFTGVFQHSQRNLPLLDTGPNTITVVAPEPTVSTRTLEGSTRTPNEHNNTYLDFHPVAEHVIERDDYLFLEHRKLRGTLTFPVSTPGPVRAVRFMGSLRARQEGSSIRFLVSDDGGATWKVAGDFPGPYVGDTRYVEFTDIRDGVRDVLVRYEMNGPGPVGLFVFRIDVDYLDPRALARPVLVTYRWTEEGEPRQHVSTITEYPTEYTIDVEGTPVMTSLTIEPFPQSPRPLRAGG